MTDGLPGEPGESRWPPALAILGGLLLIAALRGHVFVMPVSVAHVGALLTVGAMAAVSLTNGSPLWLLIEHRVILLLATLYVLNTIAELADTVGVVTFHASGNNAFSLMSSSIVIWVANVMTFSLVYWQIDRGGPRARASGAPVRPDWVFPQPATPDDLPPPWRPWFLDYLYLAFNTATAFSPTDILPLTRRAKMLMMLESTISLLTTVIVLSRAVNALPG